MDDAIPRCGLSGASVTRPPPCQPPTAATESGEERGSAHGQSRSHAVAGGADRGGPGVRAQRIDPRLGVRAGEIGRVAPDPLEGAGGHEALACLGVAQVPGGREVGGGPLAVEDVGCEHRVAPAGDPLDHVGDPWPQSERVHEEQHARPPHLARQVRLCGATGGVDRELRDHEREPSRVARPTGPTTRPVPRLRGGGVARRAGARPGRPRPPAAGRGSPPARRCPPWPARAAGVPPGRRAPRPGAMSARRAR